MLVTAVKRLATLVVGVGATVALVSLVIGLLVGSSVSRSVSLGLYLSGSFLMVAGFFVGQRGPLRAWRPEEHLPFRGPRGLRQATEAERADSVSLAALFVALGLVLVLCGLLADTRLRLF